MKRVTKIITIIVLIGLFLLTMAYDKECIDEDRQAQKDCIDSMLDNEDNVLLPFESGE